MYPERNAKGSLNWNERMLDGNLKPYENINSPVKVNNTWTNIKNTLILILFITPLGIF